jgi:hypothetical protein
VDESFAVNILASAARTRQEESIAQRPQRGIAGGGRKFPSEHLGSQAREPREGESIAQRPQRGIRMVDKNPQWTP